MSKISQKLLDKQRSLAMVDRAVAAELSSIHGKEISQQTYNAWKKGRVPTDSYTTTLARWLDLPIDELAALLAADRAAGGPSRVSAFTSLAYVAERGKIADRKDGKYRFTGTRPVPEGRYVMQVDTKVMEPVFHVGTQIWLDPAPMALPLPMTERPALMADLYGGPLTSRHLLLMRALMALGLLLSFKSWELCRMFVSLGLDALLALVGRC